MNDQERLDGMKEIFKSQVYNINGAVTFGRTDAEWLIQQAERVQELEKRLDAEVESGYQMEGQLQDAKAENARLREALEFYADRDIFKPRTRPIYGPFGYAVYHILEDYGAIARHALKGESE